MYARPQQWAQNPAAYNPVSARYYAGYPGETRNQSLDSFGNPNRSSMYGARQPTGAAIVAPAPQSVRDSQTTQDSNDSYLPYLQPETPAPITAAAPPPLRPSRREPPFPRFVPPRQPSFPAPILTGIQGPPRDYQAAALAAVGGYPPTSQELGPMPVMMMQPGAPAPRSSVPVEQVMARYGQALPGEEFMPTPAPREPTNPVRKESTGPPPGAQKPQPPPQFPIDRPQSPPKSKVQHLQKQRPQSRRTQSELPSPVQSSSIQVTPIVSEEPRRTESPKQRTSMLRKLTKKRPMSDPLIQGKAKSNLGNPQGFLDPIPDVLFHVRATNDYEMQAYDELSFSAGAVIAVTAAPENGKWSGYIVGSGNSQQVGIFYRTYVNIMRRQDGPNTNGSTLFLVEAVCNYRATREDEFSFFSGDMIAVTSTPNGPFWVGVNQRAPARGKLFPWKLVAPL